MNSEIKFKARRMDNGEWVHGDLFNATLGTIIIQNGGSSREDFSFVIPETVCQLVYNHEEVEIYKHDFVECYNHDSDTYYGGYLYFNDLSMSYELEDNKGNVNIFYKYHIKGVTGNKYD